MGGKTSQSTQQVQIPPQVLAQYSAVNARANQTASNPFQEYNSLGTAVAPDYTNGNSGTFVAPINQQQQAGIGATNAAAGQAQPYYNAATGVLGATQNATGAANQAALAGTAANAAPIGADQINRYLSPYLQDVVGSESALLNQNNQQQQSGQLGTAISSGAFGGDRTGIAAANLAQQQTLANANIYSGLLNQGYNTALSTAQQQQGVGLQGAQQLANIGQTAYSEGANTSAQLAALGAGAQSAGLQGANAQIAAGTLEQQTQQAQNSAQYNQFLQKESYPFQVDQFLANIAEGTGALSGSTTTTTTPGGLFAASGGRIRREAGGLVARGAYADGGPSMLAPGDLSAILQAQQQMYAPRSDGGGPYGAASPSPYGGLAHVPAPSGAVAHLIQPASAPRSPASGLQNLNQIANTADTASRVYDNVQRRSMPNADQQVATALSGATLQQANNDPAVQALQGGATFDPSAQARGGRTGLAQGGLPYSNADDSLDIPDTTPDAKLATAGPLPSQQSSGLGQITSLVGDAAKLFGAYAAFAANQGGRIGRDAGGLIGRKGYEDGSSVDDPDRTPEQELASSPAVDAQAPSTSADVPVAAAPAAAPAAAATPPPPPQQLDNSRGQQSDKTPSPPDNPRGLAAIKQWWDDNKGYALPAIEGLSTAGTARTVHPLTALAAGLGAGARAYVPTQQGLADTQYTQAETAGQLAQNRITNAKAGLTENYANQILHPQAGLVPQPASSSSSMPAPPTGAQATAQSLDQWARDALFVPLYRGDEQQKIERAKAMDGIMGTHTADALEFDRKTRYDREVQANQNLAQHWDDAFVDQYHRAPPKSQAALAALAVHNALMQWTGDKYGESGNRYNSRNFSPGVGNAGAQFTPQELAPIAEDLIQKVDVPAGDSSDPEKKIQMRKYDNIGYGTLPDTLNAIVQASTPNAPGSAAAPVASAPASAPAPAVRQTPRATVPTNKPEPPARPLERPGQTAQAQSRDDPYADPEFFKPPPKAQVGTTFGTNTKANVEDLNTMRKKLREESEENTKESTEALQLALAAKQVLESKKAPTVGLFGDAAALLSRIPGGVDASNYQIVAKELGNLAVHAAEHNFGYTTDKKADLQFKQLSPDLAHTPEALRALLNQNIATYGYIIQTAGRAKEYIDRRGSIPDFYKWNEKHFPRAEAINATADTIGTKEGASGTSKGGEPIEYRNGQWVYKNR